MMSNVINSKGHLVAVLDEETRTVTITRRGCSTHITLDEDGNIGVVNIETEEDNQ